MKENCIKRKIRYIETFVSKSKKNPSIAFSIVFPASGQGALYRMYIVWTQLHNNKFVQEINFQTNSIKNKQIFETLETKREYFLIEKGRKYKRRDLRKKWKERQNAALKNLKKLAKKPPAQVLSRKPAETFADVLLSVRDDHVIQK